jgi:hypothetical protein
MRRPPDRKPAAQGNAAGFQKIDVLTGKIDRLEDSPNRLQLQAARIRSRFAISWPVARVVASLHYGGAA